MSGESPPPAPRACFGRDELIEEFVGFADNLTPIALIGPGGIGKTSIALAVLHHSRIKERFGDNRRFIRCDQFPTSRTHFLNQLSKVIGAGVENLEDLTPLRPFLSARKMILILDNAESILDPNGTNTREIYALVDELSRFENICLCVTSRISTIPPTCTTFDIPTLSVEAAHDAFYHIYKQNRDQSDPVDNILEQLDFHPLSITLLATVAQHNKWDTARLAREWEGQRTNMLRTHHKESLATTIELSLASSMFQKLGPNSRGLLEAVAFFPQGVNENNLHWLFPSLSDVTAVLDGFCILSLTYRNDGFVKMLSPLRDYLRPKDPASSPRLLETKDSYFLRLSADVNPDTPGFEKAQWIKSEDVNVEHLLDVFTSIDGNADCGADSVCIWDACARFMEYLHWHKTRLVVLGPAIEGLPDNHPSKPQCLFELSRLFGMVGNHAEYKRLIAHALEVSRKQGSDLQVAETLRAMSNANRLLGCYTEGIQQAKEALEIYRRLDNTSGKTNSWQRLAWLYFHNGNFDAAEAAALQVIDLPSVKGEEFPACECYRVLGHTYHSQGKIEQAINHFQVAIEIASGFSWDYQLFWNHYALAEVFFFECEFDEAHIHVESAKSHATNDPYRLGRATQLKTWFWYSQGMLEEAMAEVSSAIDLFERLGATEELKDCMEALQRIEEALNEEAATQ